MRPKSLILLALALGCGLIASIGITQVIQARNAQRATGDERADVLVALDDIALNTPLSAENVGKKSWPKESIPEGAIIKMEDIEGRRPATRIVKGEVILASKIGTGDAANRAAKDIPPNFRVVAVRVNDLAGAGLILPGDRVDVQVYVAKNPANDVAQTGLHTLLQDISVFAVNSEVRQNPNSDAPKIDAKTISLLVTPEQAAKVTLAAEVGTIRLTMRGAQPEEAGKAPKISVTEMLGGTETTEKPPVPAGVKDFLDKQADTATATPASDDVTFRMVIVQGNVPHVEEFHKGELIPRRVGDSTGPSAAPGPAENAPPLLPPGGGPSTGPAGGAGGKDAG